METNEFNALPLVQVVIRLVFEDDTIPTEIPFAIDLLEKLRKASTEELRLLDLPNNDVTPGKSSLRITLQAQRPFLVLFVHGVALKIQHDMITVQWDADTEISKYPRFDSLLLKLSNAFEAVSNLLGKMLTPLVVNMQYANKLSENRGQLAIEDYLAPEYRPKNITENSRLLNHRDIWRLGESVDFRYEIERLGSSQDDSTKGTFSFVTSSGKRLDDDQDWEQEIKEIRKLLNDTFKKLISEEAKIEWQYQK